MDYRQDVKDLSLFADAATEVKQTEESGRILVELTKSGEQRKYFFQGAGKPIEARHSGEAYSTLASLLASSEFADLRSFAATQRRVLAQKELETLIPPAGEVDPSNAQTPFSMELGRKLLEPSLDRDTLQIVLIDGPAGVGKTSLIERLVYERSADATKPPILHITSKGRRLSNLPDAIGKTASDYDARFRADQVPVLARMGAMQIAIDGFDELVQPDGYGNAWGALKDLVRSVGVGGPIILAGRDTFFDQQDVQTRLATFGTKVDLTMVRLSEVSESHAMWWLVEKGWANSEVAKSDVREFLKRPYVRRPFFLSRIADLRSFEGLPTDAGSPQGILVNRLLSREAGLILAGLANASEQDVIRALHQICEELALDMAERESDSVGGEYLGFATDYAFSGIASDDERNAIVGKVGSLALLELGEAPGERRFPHSEIQNYFFASAMFDKLLSDGMFSPLRTTIYGADVIEAFADKMRRAPRDDYHKVVDAMIALRIREKFSERLRMNTAALLFAAAARGDLDRTVNLAGAELNEVRIFDRPSPIDLSGAVIYRLDARGSNLSEVNFYDCHCVTLQADETTVFGMTIPQAGTLQIYVDGRMDSIHDATAKSDWLTDHSALATNPNDWDRHRDHEFIRYFDRLCRRFIRQHQIRNTDRDDGAQLIRDPRWNVVTELIGDRVTTLVKSTSGNDNIFYQIKSPAELLSPEPGTEAAEIRERIIRYAESIGLN